MIFLRIWFRHACSFMFSRLFNPVLLSCFNIVRPECLNLVVSISNNLVLSMSAVNPHSSIPWSRSTTAHNPILASFLCYLSFTANHLLAVFSSSKRTLFLSWHSMISRRHRLWDGCRYYVWLLPWWVDCHMLLIMSLDQLI